MNENKKIDWSKPRKNINPKTSRPYKRGRNWAIVAYPESLPKNWKDILSMQTCMISPLHDKDVNPDGTFKKAHYHIIVTYKGLKSFNQIDELARELQAPIPQQITNLSGAVRYSTHMDNPEKYQYNSKNIITYGGFDYYNSLNLSSGSKREMLKDMMKFIYDNGVTDLVDFGNYCMSEKSPDGWFEILTERNSLFIKEYIKSNWQKHNHLK